MAAISFLANNSFSQHQLHCQTNQHSISTPATMSNYQDKAIGATAQAGESAFENNKGAGVSHAQGHSSVPESVQRKVPANVEDKLPDSVHDTGSNAKTGKVSHATGDSKVPLSTYWALSCFCRLEGSSSRAPCSWEPKDNRNLELIPCTEVQEAVPAKLEKILPNSIHDTRGAGIWAATQAPMDGRRRGWWCRHDEVTKLGNVLLWWIRNDVLRKYRL